MTKNRELLGFGFAITDMVTYGLVIVFGNYFVRTIDPLLFAGTTTIISSLPLLLWLRFKKRHKEMYAPKFFKPLLLVSLFSAIASSLLFLGTKLTSGINTGLLLQLEPVYAIIISFLLLGEIVSLSRLAATLIMVIGAVVLVYRGFTVPNIGDLIILITPLFFQFSHVYAKRIINKVNDINIIPATRLLYSGLMILAFVVIINPASLWQLTNISNIFSIVFFAVVFRTLDTALWYQAIGKISVSKAAAVIPLSAAVSFVGSMIVLGEVPVLRQYLGLIFIMAGLVWISWVQLRNSKP